MKVAVLMPVFNHRGTVARVIEKVRAAIAGVSDIGEMVVVDDGCTDGSGEILQGLEEAGEITLLSHEINRGKGQALLTGFRYASEKGYTHVLTVDADGQHDECDIAGLLAASREHVDDLIIGYRDMETAGVNVPTRSKKGRDAARFWLRVQTGQDIPDSQCGLRVYPLAHVLEARYRFLRFDFETEVLARMAWGGVRVRSVPVRCIYFPAGERVSHFRPVMDTLRGVRVNVFLVMRRLLPLPFRRLTGVSIEAATFGKWWKGATWRDAIRAIARTGSTNGELAAAFAVGIFVGLTPFYFVQTFIAIYFARRLHLNVLAAVVGSQISIPPLVPVWMMLSYGVGNLVLHGRWIAAHFAEISREMIPAFLLGNFLVALGVAICGLFAARGVLSMVRTKRAVE